MSDFVIALVRSESVAASGMSGLLAIDSLISSLWLVDSAGWTILIKWVTVKFLVGCSLGTV